ncbi:MAG: hypothetical protein CFE40_09400 [Burkholderiales bacterium PBB1]|nr:MAG: hypothetical protein CFE40_09400 [Burkholderiales bacterium PBB1]
MNETRRFHELDALRFLAALAVVFLHYGVRGFADGDNLSPIRMEYLAHLVKYNYLAVNLFFMISGFVILMTAQSNSVIKFVKSRIVRLYPALWISCTLTFIAISFFMADKIATSWPRYFANLTMFNGFVGIGGIDGPYWSLYVEMKFYVLVGLLIASGNLRRVEMFMAGWLLISILNYRYPSAVVEYIFIPKYASYFIAGCTLFLLGKSRNKAFNYFLLICSFIVGLMYDADVLLEKSLWYKFHFSVIALIVILMAFYSFFLFIVFTKGEWIRPSWAAAFGVGGSISYPLYLLHNGIGLSIISLIYPYFQPLVVLGVTVVAVIFLSWLVHRWGERPLAKWLRDKLLLLEQRSELAFRKFQRKPDVDDVADPVIK